MRSCECLACIALGAQALAALVANLPRVRGATCVLLSQIGRPIDDPQVADVRLALGGPTRVEDVREDMSGVVQRHLAQMTRACCRSALISPRRPGMRPLRAVDR